MIPFFYITSKMASEKESKSKEGMKMMGLNDSTYYLAWFILFSLISFVTSLIVSIITCVRLFKNINFIILFTFLTFYSWTLLGLAFIIVAFLPNKRSSAVAAVLLNFMTFFLSPILQDPATP
jgi:ATP-binding cassette subfamily A (ABC1) protein 5